MDYFVKRGEERFGPYSLSDLQKYVQSGNVVVEDLTQSEGMTEWVPVSQVLGNIPAMPAAGTFSTMAAEPQLIADQTIARSQHRCRDGRRTV